MAKKAVVVTCLFSGPGTGFCGHIWRLIYCPCIFSWDCMQCGIEWCLPGKAALFRLLHVSFKAGGGPETWIFLDFLFKETKSQRACKILVDKMSIKVLGPHIWNMYIQAWDTTLRSLLYDPYNYTTMVTMWYAYICTCFHRLLSISARRISD